MSDSGDDFESQCQVAEGGERISGARNRRIAFLVVNYFSHAEVLEMIASLVRLQGAAMVTVCVVDNSCDQEEWNALTAGLQRFDSWKHSVSSVRSSTNSGFSAGNNLGFEAISAFQPDVVCTINPDVIVDFMDLDGAIEAILAEPGSIFGAKTKSHGKVLSGLAAISLLTGRSRELSEDEESKNGELLYPGGHFMAMSAMVWRSLGGLSEDYFLFGEEADTVLRLRSSHPHMRIASLASVVVVHTGGLTSGASSSLSAKSLVTFRHATRSSVILFRKHQLLRSRLPLVIFARLMYASKTLLSVGPSAAKTVLVGLREGLTWRDSDR